MAYVNNNDVMAVRNELKVAFPEFKFGVSKEHHSAIRVTIVSGPTDFSDLFTDEYSQRKQYIQVNTYWLEKFYGVHAKFLEKIVDIIKTAPARGEGYHKGTGYYNNSDAQVDYFDYAYHFSLNIGAWNKPYEVIAKKSKAPKAKAKSTVTVRGSRTVGAGSTSGAKFATVNEVSGYNPRDNVAPDPTFSYFPTTEQLLRSISQ